MRKCLFAYSIDELKELNRKLEKAHGKILIGLLIWYLILVVLFVGGLYLTS